MSTQTVQATGVAAMPRVNLMPPEIAEAERFRRLQLAMGGAVFASLVVVGLLYHHAKSGVSAAQSQVTTAQTQNAALKVKLNGLSSVSATYASVQGKQALLQQAMGQEIRWSYLLNDLSFRTPNNLWLTSINATETSATAAGAATPAPGATPTLGTIVFAGTAMKHDNVATWLDDLARERGLVDPTFGSSAENFIGSTKIVNWTTTVGIDSTALSNRYVVKAGN